MSQEKVLEKIKKQYSQLTKTQKMIAGFIIENHTRIPSMPVQELAKELHTSDATIIRFAQVLGYKGYLEMRAELKEEVNQYYAPQSRFSRVQNVSSVPSSDGTTTGSIADVIAYNDLQYHKDFYENFDRRLINDVVVEINKATTIHIAGFGTDSIPATFLDWYLGLMGYHTECYTDGGFATSRRISSIKETDLLILFSTPRHLKIEKSVVCAAKSRNATTVGISPDSVLELSSQCDIMLCISSRSNELINSYVTYMSLCNMLIMSVFESNKNEISKRLQASENVEHYFDVLL